MASSSSQLIIEDRFYTTNLGDLMLIKACGFIEDHQARIVDVAENMLKLRVGNSLLEQFFYKCSKDRPAEITLQIRDSSQDGDIKKKIPRLPAIACSQIDVTIAPRSRAWKQEDFERFARRILWSLREHFVTP